ncbi:hypothetical protein ACHQM5_018239 [Ranunculus cassubicifolius]
MLKKIHTWKRISENRYNTITVRKEKNSQGNERKIRHTICLSNTENLSSLGGDPVEKQKIRSIFIGRRTWSLPVSNTLFIDMLPTANMTMNWAMSVTLQVSEYIIMK